MSFYRTLLAAVAAIAIASPVFADDTTNTTGTTETTMQTTENTTTTGDQGTMETKVNLNTATAKQLRKIKGINASTARAIVAYRKKHGDFKTTEDITNVKAVKKLNADTIKTITDQLTIE